MGRGKRSANDFEMSGYFDGVVGNVEPWDPSFVTPEQYIKSQLKMMRKELGIELSNKEAARLNGLKSKSAIDAAVQTIINQWSDD